MAPDYADYTHALHSHAHATAAVPIPTPLTAHGVPSVTARPRPRAARLDMRSVPARLDRDHKSTAAREGASRALPLTEAPTYKPTIEEFADPFTYIAAIAPEAREYGIVKIIPPDSWRPQFALDTERFWFRSRRQELNAMEGGSRTALNFLDQLHKFHKQRGVVLNRLPSVDRRPLDLYHLKKAVDMRAGFDSVCKKKQWAEIGRELGYHGKIMTSLSTSLKAAYQKYVMPYELYLRSAKPIVQQQLQDEQGGPFTPLVRARTVSADSVDGSATPKRGLSTEADTSVSPSPKRIKPEDPPTVAGSNMLLHRPSGSVKRMSSRTNHTPGENCEVCGRGDSAESMLLCDGCDAGYHMACLKPSLKTLPDYDWYCDKCLVGTGEYGFEDGGIYNLRQFQEKARNFKERYFMQKGIAPGQATERDVEAEFWRLVEDLDSTVEVEYGADIHSTIHGSGFPTIERDPLDPYAADPWNLNIMPLHEKSLLRHIKTDVSGMTVPWLYVGMVFSTFCWHSEDHNTYSINYQHFGETKTWYGIPGADADKFEDAMRRAVPELFEQQPDLLFQLVTMLSPKRLIEENVRCHVIDQRPGEFVVTFPQAYHAGFNHGFNFNEAVNFAPADWEPFGRAGVEAYQDYRKLPVFSHDELLLTAAARDTSIETAFWLGPALKIMEDQELMMRAHIRQLFPHITEEYAPQDLPEGDMQCAYCNAYCYLSQIRCPCTKNVVCLNHYDELCECDRTTRVLRTKMSETELDTIVTRVNERAHVPHMWLEKYTALTTGDEKPTFKALRSLLTEAEKIQYPIPQVEELRRVVAAGNEWIEDVQKILARKHQQRRRAERPLTTTAARPTASRRTSARASSVASDAATMASEEPVRKPEYLDDLLLRVQALPFTTAEVDALEERRDEIRDFEKHATAALADGASVNRDMLVGLIEQGYSLNVEIPQIEGLELRLAQLTWKKQVTDAMKAYMYLTEVDAMLHEGAELGFNAQDTLFAALTRKKELGDQWERDVSEGITAGVPDLNMLEDKYDDAATVSVTKHVYEALEQFLIQNKELTEAVDSFFARAETAELTQRARYKEVRQVLDKLHNAESGVAIEGTKVLALERMARKVEEWLHQGRKIFHKVNAGLHVLTTHLEAVEQRDRMCFLLDDRPSPGATTDEENKKEIFCICRLPESGLMIECETCHEWYHNRCLKIPRGALKQAEFYLCPICDPEHARIHRDSHRATLAELQQWLASATSNTPLPLYPDELGVLTRIVECATKFERFVNSITLATAGKVQQAAGVDGLSEEDVYVLKFYLRKLEGAEVVLPPQTEFLKATVAEVARRRTGKEVVMVADDEEMVNVPVAEEAAPAKGEAASPAATPSSPATALVPVPPPAPSPLPAVPSIPASSASSFMFKSLLTTTGTLDENQLQQQERERQRLRQAEISQLRRPSSGAGSDGVGGAGEGSSEVVIP
ncbi:PLU-1-like protein-domain-containing protein [Limtongia smithiae]|uniref:PLU-1-like protein-domain-containing protein n=1 Tax=Limtongia smithiae TaxID=1125753 RepID=UPI0034CE13F1